jgi:hypothetical protein
LIDRGKNNDQYLIDSFFLQIMYVFQNYYILLHKDMLMCLIINEVFGKREMNVLV